MRACFLKKHSRNSPFRRVHVPLFSLLALALLASCARPAAAPTPAVHRQPSAAPSPSSTNLPTATETGLPSPAPTETPVPCDPASAEYCITGGTFTLQRPIAAPGTQGVDHGYAYGAALGGKREPHHGVEFYSASGTPVLAAASGTVYYAGGDAAQKFSPWSNFYGQLVILEHRFPGQALYTLYAHLSRLEVAAGQSVDAGEQIGAVGMTGSAFGNHLHFEVRLEPEDYDSTRNPELWLIPLPGTGVLSLRFVDSGGAFIPARPNVQYFPDPNAASARSWGPEVYAPQIPSAGENAALGDLPAGRYRLTFMWAGLLYERWVEIQPGKLTQVEFKVP